MILSGNHLQDQTTNCHGVTSKTTAGTSIGTASSTTAHTKVRLQGTKSEYSRDLPGRSRANALDTHRYRVPTIAGDPKRLQNVVVGSGYFMEGRLAFGTMDPRPRLDLMELAPA